MTVKRWKCVLSLPVQVQFFNNFLADPNRPCLPDAPKRDSRMDSGGGGGHAHGGSAAGGGGNYGRSDYNVGYNQSSGSSAYMNRRGGGGYYDSQGTTAQLHSELIALLVFISSCSSLFLFLGRQNFGFRFKLGFTNFKAIVVFLNFCVTSKQ